MPSYYNSVQLIAKDQPNLQIYSHNIFREIMLRPWKTHPSMKSVIFRKFQLI